MELIPNFVAWTRQVWDDIRNAKTNAHIADVQQCEDEMRNLIADEFASDLKAMNDSFADDRNTARKEAEVDAGNFLYYVVNEHTNVRNMHDGVPIIYKTRGAAEYDCEEAEYDCGECDPYQAAISVAEYNRLYAQFTTRES